MGFQLRGPDTRRAAERPRDRRHRVRSSYPPCHEIGCTGKMRPETWCRGYCKKHARDNGFAPPNKSQAGADHQNSPKNMKDEKKLPDVVDAIPTVTSEIGPDREKKRETEEQRKGRKRSTSGEERKGRTSGGCDVTMCKQDHEAEENKLMTPLVYSRRAHHGREACLCHGLTCLLIHQFVSCGPQLVGWCGIRSSVDGIVHGVAPTLLW